MDKRTWPRMVTTAVGGLVVLALLVPAGALATPPTITGMPSFSGKSVTTGDTLDASGASSPDGDLSYQWQSCDPNGGCSDIVDATLPSYTAQSSDETRQLLVLVTSTNPNDATDKTTLDSGRTNAVQPPPPPEVAPQWTSGPTVTGTARIGQTLTATAEASGSPTPVISLQWQRCDANGCVTFGPAANGEAGAAEATYTLKTSDYGFKFAVMALASNGVDPAAGPTQSNQLGPVAGTPPQMNAPPTIKGTTVVGQTLTATAAATGVPQPTFAYSWLRCSDTPVTCAPIPGASPGNTYVLTASDAGSTIAVDATASNGELPDAGPVRSAQTNPISTSPQVDTPTVTGIAVAGQTLRADANASGVPTPTVTFEWRRCDSGGGRCSSAADATGQQYKLQSGDVGHTLKLTATASNGTQPDDSKSIITAVIKRADSGSPTPAQSSFDTSVPTAVGPGTQTVTTTASGQSTPAKAIEFPKVRIRGKLARGGVRLSYFAVLAPDTWRVEVTCSGRSCPKPKVIMSTKGSSTRLRTYERYLRAGVRLVIRISRPNVIGKYSSFVIHANGAPQRRDLCLPPNSKKAIKCAA
jgi:hypothetical protein